MIRKAFDSRGFFHFEAFICNRLRKDRRYFLDVWRIIPQSRSLPPSSPPPPLSTRSAAKTLKTLCGLDGSTENRLVDRV